MSPTGPSGCRALRPIEVDAMEEPSLSSAPAPHDPPRAGPGSRDRLATLGRLAAMLLAAESAEEVARASLEAISRTMAIARRSVTEVDHEKWLDGGPGSPAGTVGGAGSRDPARVAR